MNAPRKSEGLSRLTQLADDLARVYSAAGDKVAEAIRPLDEAIGRIGVGFRSKHVFESIEDAESRIEYRLCANRWNKVVRLSVLVTTLCVMRRDTQDADQAPVLDAGGRPKMEFVSDEEVLPSEVALPIRVKILDALDGFATEYEAHVRATRKNLLDGSVVPTT